jgi:hypothetical protein
MEATDIFETLLLIYRSTWHRFPEDDAFFTGFSVMNIRRFHHSLDRDGRSSKLSLRDRSVL